ncbi:MAG: formate dehydrogenase [Myxococcales bacterium]|nr:formate dehydrogenase [Myxococcales bacterium]
MAKMMMLIDPSRCTGCRGCQVACKQWNGNVATKTTFTGTYQNPPDFDGDTFTLVRFKEYPVGAFGVYWLMTNDKCRHCAEPTCVEAMPKDGYVIHESGAVVYTDKAKAVLKDVVDSCPFAIPTLNKKSGLLAKCTLCADRTAEGMEPACAKTCPTDAILWGEQETMMKYAKERIAWLKTKNGDRFKADKIKLYPDEGFGCHVRWILLDDYAKHGLVGEM